MIARASWTAREELAAMAMQGLLANPSGPFQSNPSCGWSLCNCTMEQVTDLCFSVADQMLLASIRAAKSVIADQQRTNSDAADADRYRTIRMQLLHRGVFPAGLMPAFGEQVEAYDARVDDFKRLL